MVNDKNNWLLIALIMVGFLASVFVLDLIIYNHWNDEHTTKYQPVRFVPMTNYQDLVIQGPQRIIMINDSTNSITQESWDRQQALDRANLLVKTRVIS